MVMPSRLFRNVEKMRRIPKSMNAEKPSKKEHPFWKQQERTFMDVGYPNVSCSTPKLMLKMQLWTNAML